MNTPQERTNAALLDIVERCLKLLPEPELARIHALTRPWKYKDEIDVIIANLEQMVREDELTEPARARIHALTRKVTISDEELISLIPGPSETPGREIVRMLQDLRDRYEERGKYAPHQAATVAESGTNES